VIAAWEHSISETTRAVDSEKLERVTNWFSRLPWAIVPDVAPFTTSTYDGIEVITGSVVIRLPKSTTPNAFHSPDATLAGIEAAQIQRWSLRQDPEAKASGDQLCRVRWKPAAARWSDGLD
jgi:hypothetical protein